MEKNKRIKLFWFVVMFFNFIFGVTGVIICSFKIKHSDDEEVQIGFFKLSMLFAACNLILSVLLLIAVLKKDQKYAFLYALLIFISLFAATMHIESHTSHNYTYLIIFVVFGKYIHIILLIFLKIEQILHHQMIPQFVRYRKFEAKNSGV
ncbi:uncharacterized protein LOC130896891 isoform X1 [Diorhabda carinulata]|uniref:uncharacterized protein LOC130896891 isoform X1 n=1 Tax=Diorhabda carinulata TaxID=1163345 RepID=UPI00259FFF5C|nr:uncharacterized protein LOC130896891 isoform X1 [Diorhabda carinulata]